MPSTRSEATRKDRGVHEFEAMGTHWWCELLDTTIFPDDLRNKINQMVEQFIATYSRFDEHSLLSRLNQTGSVTHPPAEFVSTMKFAREMFEASDGTFNISVGGKLHDLGYGSRTHRNRVNSALWDDTVVSDTCIRIPKNTTIDFGGFGKGWLIDKIAALLRANGYESFIINGGGDILVSSRKPIELALEHPTDRTRAIGSVKITHGSLAASSNVKRAWKTADGTTKHHIIDPATNDSAVGIVTATFVQANSTLVADAIATILLINPRLVSKLRQRYHCEVLFYPNNQ